MKASIAFAALGLWLVFVHGACAQAPPENPAAIQRDFEAAMGAEARDDLPAAIEILTALAAQTDAPRVRLELARMQFKAGQYRRSRKTFNEVYARDLPYPVRRSVNIFLDDIDQRVGYVRPTVGGVLDSNARQQPLSGTYDVLGAPLTFRNTEQPSTAVRYQLDALAPLVRRGDIQWQAIASVAGTATDAAGSDSQSVDLALRSTQLARRTSVAAGWRGAQNGGLETSAPYVQIERLITPRRDRQISLLAGVETTHVPGRTDLTGETARLAARYARDLGRNLTVQLSTGASVSTIRDPQWPRSTGYFEVSAIRSLPRTNLNLVAGGGVLMADFSGRDLFFGRVRRDTAINLQIAAYSAHPIYGFFPGVVVRQDLRRSSIAFYSYDRVVLAMDMRRRF